MIVRMVVGISGSRNDSAWPPPGGELEVSDAEGQELIAIGLAVKVSGSVKAEPEKDVAAPLEDLKTAAVDYADSEAETADDEEDQDADEEPGGGQSQKAGGPPRPAAPKQDWVDWAVAQGAEWITATNSTKQLLMEQYGQRP